MFQALMFKNKMFTKVNTAALLIILLSGVAQSSDEKQPHSSSSEHGETLGLDEGLSVAQSVEPALCALAQTKGGGDFIDLADRAETGDTPGTPGVGTIEWATNQISRTGLGNAQVQNAFLWGLMSLTKQVIQPGMTKLSAPQYRANLSDYGIKKIGKPVSQVAKPQKVQKQPKKVEEPKVVYGWRDFACQNSKKPPKAMIHYYDENGVKYFCEPKIVIGANPRCTIRLVETKTSAELRNTKARKRLGYPTRGRGKKTHSSISSLTHEMTHNKEHDYYVIRVKGTDFADSCFNPKPVRKRTSDLQLEEPVRKRVCADAKKTSDKPVFVKQPPSLDSPVESSSCQGSSKLRKRNTSDILNEAMLAFSRDNGHGSAEK